VNLGWLVHPTIKAGRLPQSDTTRTGTDHAKSMKVRLQYRLDSPCMSDDFELPDYRRLAITYYASFTNGSWIAERQIIPLHPSERRACPFV
jgi:hypothetical protein